MLKKKPGTTTTQLKVLTGEELESVTGGGKGMITALFAYGRMSVVISATKDEYSVALSLPGKS